MNAFRSSLLLLCFLLPLTSAVAQDNEKAEKPGRSVVHGRVIFADSEQPLRRATLRLRKAVNQDFLKRAVSDKRGEFSFQRVSAGTYYIEVDAPGVVSLAKGVSFTDLGFSMEDSSMALVTVDGANDVKTEVRAIRGAVMTGRISYGDGEPATHAQIVLYRQKGQTPTLFFLDTSLFTDDRGVYRIEGLPAGQYIVGAVENHSGGGKTLPRNAAGLVTAFHPAAPNVSAATIVDVQAGSEIRDVNIKFVDDVRRLSGTMKWKQSTAEIEHAIVFLRRVGDPQIAIDYERFLSMVTPLSGINGGDDKDDLVMRDMFFMSLLTTNFPSIETDEKGRWSFQDLPQGTYIVSVEAPIPVDKPMKRKPSNNSLETPDLDSPDFTKGIIRGSAEVKIADKDVDNVVIELTQGASIIGTIDRASDAESPVAVKVAADGLQVFFNLPGYVNSDGSFELRSVRPGVVRLDIFEPPGRSNFYVRSITAKGLDLLNEPLTVADGEQVTGVQIVLGTDLATVEGHVVPASGDGSVAGAGVVLLPADQRKWNTRSFWGLARADAEGKFSLRLAPGEYIAVAWSLANEPTEPLDSYARSRLSTAQRVTLKPNETKALEVQVPTNAH